MSAGGTTKLANDPDVILSDDELGKLCDFFYRKTGIRMDVGKRYFLDRRIAERIRATESPDFRTYFQILFFETSGRELQELTNLMTVNETYFFRENYQFDCLVNSMLDEVAKRKGRKGDRIKVWSMPCATGEESYTIAIHMLERWAKVDDYEIEIHASDIDSTVLRRAAEGIYDERALEKVPSYMRQRYLTYASEGTWQVRSELRSSIEFSLVNITDPNQMWRFRDFDVIFCRNLLIYFDEVSRRQAAGLLYEALSPGGFICLGHSESMSRISSAFQPRKFPDALVYQKPLNES